MALSDNDIFAAAKNISRCTEKNKVTAGNLGYLLMRLTALATRAVKQSWDAPQQVEEYKILGDEYQLGDGNAPSGAKLCLCIGPRIGIQPGLYYVDDTNHYVYSKSSSGYAQELGMYSRAETRTGEVYILLPNEYGENEIIRIE